MRISDWSSDVCSSDLAATTDVCSVSDHDDARRRCSILRDFDHGTPTCGRIFDHLSLLIDATGGELVTAGRSGGFGEWIDAAQNCREQRDVVGTDGDGDEVGIRRSEEHTSELQSLMRISYAVFCLKKKQTPDCT